MKHIKEYNTFEQEREEINTEPSIEEIDSNDLESVGILVANGPEKYREEMRDV